MSDQPEALFLADVIENDPQSKAHHDAAAAELRRQHALIKEWEAKAETWLLSPEAAQRLDGYRELSQRAWRAEIDLTATEAELREVSDRAFKAEAECDALRAFRAGVLRCRYPVCPTIEPSRYGWDMPRLNEVIDAARAALKEPK